MKCSIRSIADRLFESENSRLACAVSAAPSSPRVQAAFPAVPGAQWCQIEQVSKGNLGILKDLEYNCHSSPLSGGTVTTVKRYPAPLMSVVAVVII